ncbi:FAD:protein FMN transferase [Arthrobacter sp. MSA 4-2]|uniref:FAD:protein FMN transferase n=1 Tax=Arthrobacter sp. MSA 4-2 TaxID=2794349 RepID=UPI0018E7DD1E|nr:FAD:protein FMN transferase [Arthrobacter sp. MSA 4-2]MBJ2121999.1 FAD:protein FMN transferase [Arthrobacter sp. MSA 4-2]
MAVGGSFIFEAIGTRWQIDTAVALEPEVRAAIAGLIEDYDALYSRFRPDSAVAALAAGGGRLALPAHGAALGRLYQKLYRLTNGSMSPLVGSVLEHQGYDALYSFTPKGPPAPARVWDEALDWEGPVVTAHGPVTLDVGAAGKGQLVDLVGGLLTDAGHTEFLVDASGDMLHTGATALTVGLEHPYDPARAIGTVQLHGRALCASASNRRAWGDGLHHVIDARTGTSVSTVVATWVLAADTMTADALATALFLAEPEVLAAEFAFDFVQVFSDGHARFSPTLNGALFTP